MQLPVSFVIKDIAVVAEDLEFDSDEGGQRLATDAMFLRSCVALALSRGDGSRHSLHASAL